jgi:hypothetical protein
MVAKHPSHAMASQVSIGNSSIRGCCRKRRPSTKTVFDHSTPKEKGSALPPAGRSPTDWEGRDSKTRRSRRQQDAVVAAAKAGRDGEAAVGRPERGGIDGRRSRRPRTDTHPSVGGLESEFALCNGFRSVNLWKGRMGVLGKVLGILVMDAVLALLAYFGVGFAFAQTDATARSLIRP